jgi:hypothetical protein
VAHLRTFLTMFALLFAAVAISAPAVARGMHGLSHAAKPVANGEHHHHDADGGVATHGADHESTPTSDDSPAGKFGHSHMASSAFDVLSQPTREMPASTLVGAESPHAANTPALGTLGWSPQKRPPRTA